MKNIKSVIAWIDLKYRNVFMLPNKEGKRRLVKNPWTGKIQWTRGVSNQPTTEEDFTNKDIKMPFRMNSFVLSIPGVNSELVKSVDYTIEAVYNDCVGTLNFAIAHDFQNNTKEFVNSVFSGIKQGGITLEMKDANSQTSHVTYFDDIICENMTVSFDKLNSEPVIYLFDTSVKKIQSGDFLYVIEDEKQKVAKPQRKTQKKRKR